MLWHADTQSLSLHGRPATQDVIFSITKVKCLTMYTRIVKRRPRTIQIGVNMRQWSIIWSLLRIQCRRGCRLYWSRKLKYSKDQIVIPSVDFRAFTRIKILMREHLYNV